MIEAEIVGEEIRLKYDKDVTIEEVVESLRSYNYYNVTTVINDCKISNRSNTLEEDVKKAFSRLGSRDFIESVEIKGEIDRMKNFVLTAEKVKKDMGYKYYLGLIKRYVLPEKREEFEYKMIEKYSIKTRKILKKVASVVVALDSQRCVEIFEGLNAVFGEEDDCTLASALDIIREYTVFNKKIDAFIYTYGIDDEIESMAEYVEHKEQELAEIKTKYRF